jgi:hypothetical protein
MMILFLASCGGGSNNSPAPLPPASKIPITSAVVAIPPLLPITPVVPVNPNPTKAILRNVYRNTVSGDLKPDANYVDSDNATVEKRGILGLYFNVNREADNRYLIDPESNGLAYFKVTNTSPNGFKRIHNFYGVVPGYYMTLDSSSNNFQAPANPFSHCKNVAIRIVNLPVLLANSRIIINGAWHSNAVIETNKAYLNQVNLCPGDANKHYFLSVVVENSASDIRYGFNFYQDLNDNDLLEININQQADIVPWTSDQALGKSYDLNGVVTGLSIQQRLYSSPDGGKFSGTFPEFTAVAITSYRFKSDTSDLTIGVDLNTREIMGDAQQADFTINDIKLNNVSLTPLELSWQNIGNDQPNVVTGTIFDIGFTQTYAFMSMDPGVINNAKFTFPIEDLPLLIDSSLASLIGAAGTANSNSRYLGESALYSGFLYWPPLPETSLDNSDLFLTATGNDLLQLILDPKNFP